MRIIDKYNQRADCINSLLCIGLDSEFVKLPKQFKKLQYPQFEFNKWIIEQTQEFVSAYKPNMAFYEVRGSQGLLELAMTMDYLNSNFPDIVTICDAKRADIGNTNNQYAEAIFNQLGFDAITLHPYLGQEAIQPFLDRKNKACIVLCKTSNPGSGELQDLNVNDKPLWQVVAQRVVEEWNKNDNCMLVVGATYPEDLAKVRAIVGEMTLLVPGIGAQGGDLEKIVKVGLNKNNKGLMINSSRGIIFSENPKESAKELRDEINGWRK